MLCVCWVGLGMEDSPHSNDLTQGWHPLIAGPVNAFFSALGTSNNHPEIPTPTKTSSTPTPESLPLRVAPGHAPVIVLAPHTTAPATSPPETALKPAAPTAAEPEKFHPTWVFKDYRKINPKAIEELWAKHSIITNDAAALKTAWANLKSQAEENLSHANHDISMISEIKRGFEEYQMYYLCLLQIAHLTSSLDTKIQEMNALQGKKISGMFSSITNRSINQEIQSKNKEIADLRAKLYELNHFKETYKHSQHIPERPKQTKCKLLGLFVSPTLQRQY